MIIQRAAREVRVVGIAVDRPRLLNPIIVCTGVSRPDGGGAGENQFVLQTLQVRAGGTRGVEERRADKHDRRDATIRQGSSAEARSESIIALPRLAGEINLVAIK